MKSKKNEIRELMLKILVDRVFQGEFDPINENCVDERHYHADFDEEMQRAFDIADRLIGGVESYLTSHLGNDIETRPFRA